MSKLPILVLAFNRADHVVQAMKAIQAYQPERLYLECDGPRLHKTGERESVEETRKAMLDAVNWPCKVFTLFREENLGCANAVYDAITWFFNNEEYGIVCEDDIILSPDFFRFCEDLLPRYSKEEKIMQIVAQNHSHRSDINNSYVYSYREDCWGWASWSRAWKKMDMSMSSVPNLSMLFLIRKLGFFEAIMQKRVFVQAYNDLSNFNSWAYRWFLSILVNDGLVIVPGVNMAINIGISGGAHYEVGDVDPYADLEIGKIEWPLLYNDSLEVDNKQSKYDENDFFRLRMIGLRKKIRKLLHIL